nr:hypothetical protein [uncultured bacterium]
MTTGMPSKKACMDKLTKSIHGILVLFVSKCTCPCSAPLEKNSRTICNNIPNKINRPICFGSWCSYNSGNNSKMSTDNRKAPLKAKNNFSSCLLFG